MPTNYNGERKTGFWNTLVQSLTRSGKAAVEVFVGNDSLNPIPVAIDPADTPTITNITSPATANDEFSHALQANVKKFMVRSRTNANLIFGFTTGFTEYVTIPKGASYYQDGVNLGSSTLFLKCDKSSQTIEILEWS